jgi:hypothetical protein
VPGLAEALVDEVEASVCEIARTCLASARS